MDRVVSRISFRRSALHRVALHKVALYFAALLMWVGLPTRHAHAQSTTLAQSVTPVLTVDAAGNPHPINPDIYGMANYGLDANYAKEIQIPNIRWGGDGHSQRLSRSDGDDLQGRFERAHFDDHSDYSVGE